MALPALTKTFLGIIGEKAYCKEQSVESQPPDFFHAFSLLLLLVPSAYCLFVALTSTARLAVERIPVHQLVGLE
jgi:hypothetical protein